MSFRTDFYNASIRKYVTVFGGLFDSIQISKQNSSGTDVISLKVPVSYGPREKFLARVVSDPNLDRGYSTLLPRMGFEMIKMEYDITRKLSSTQTYAGSSLAKNGYDKIYVPVPYDMFFRLSILVKETEDGAKILEQIIPFFTPDYTLTLLMLDDLPNYKIDVPIILTNVTMEDTYDTDYKIRRTLIYTLDFIMKGYFFGPVTKSPVIKIATTNIYGNSYGYTTTSDFTSEIKPGLLANNYPTSNATLTLPIEQIFEANNYGYIISQTEYPNNA